MKRLIGIMVGVALLGWAASSMAGPGGGWGRGQGPGMGMGMGYGANPYTSAYLGLTPEQTAQIQAMREAHYKEIAPLQEQMFSKRQELRLLWSAASPDQGKIAAKQKEITELQAQLQQMSTQHQLEARKILTPEQQQKLTASIPGRGFGPGWGKGRMGRAW